MFCNKCGAQIPDGTKFCNKCGAPVGGANPAPANGPAANPAPANNAAPVNNAVPPMQQPMNGMPMQQPMNGMPMNGMMPPKKPVNKKLIIGICSAVAVIALAVVALIIILNIKPKVKLNSYVDAEFSGYDTLGSADVEIDTDAIVKKYGKKIKGTSALNKLRKEEGITKSDMSDAEMFAELVDEAYYVSSSSYLSNGDTIEIEWDKDTIKEIKKYFKVELEYKDFEIEVKGLEEAEVIDPFEDLEVDFKGVSGDGYAELEYNGDYDIDFYVGSNYYLSEGDVVTVYTDGGKDSYIRQGIILSETEKTYTVEGLSTYATKLSQIPSSDLKKMQDKAEDLAESYDYSSYFELADCNLVATYFMSSKDSYSSYNNIIYFVYEVTLDSTYNDDYSGLKCYCAVRFDDALISPDGEFDIDLDDAYVPYDWFYADYDKGSWDYGSVYAFETLDIFAEDYIEYYSDDYNIEEDIDKNAFTDKDEDEEEEEEEEEEN